MKKKVSLINSILPLLKGYYAKLSIGLFFAIICSALSFVPYLAVYRILIKLRLRDLQLSFIILWALISIASAILKSVFMSLASLCTHTAAFNTMHKLRLKVLQRMSTLNLGFFNDNAEGRIKTALFDDIGRLENFIGHNLLELIQSFIVPIILFVTLLVIQPIMSLCILIPAVLGIVIPMKIMSGYPELTNEFTQSLSSVNASVNEMVSGMHVLKMYNLSGDHFKRYTTTISSYTSCLKKMAKYSCAPLAVTVVILDSSILFTLPIGGYMYLNGTLSVANFLLFILLSTCFFNSFFNLINIKMGIIELKSGLSHVQEILDLEPVPNGHVKFSPYGHHCIEFKDVSFSYGDVNALSHVNIKILPGTVTAFVGVSGAGKTTAAQLIGRYWNVTSGEIKINGTNIKDIDNHSLMDLTAFVFQDVFMLNDTLFENISMGSNAPYSKVIEAAKAAQIHEFIESLPHGYHTHFGSMGTKLSGGQKQRIAIARAILKNAPIVIFDEATSFSDIENEHKIQRALLRLLNEKTTIMIAHRLHTIKNADNIVVFDEGKVVEQGTHQALLNKKGTYSRMWNTYVSSSIKEAI